MIGVFTHFLKRGKLVKNAFELVNYNTAAFLTFFWHPFSASHCFHHHHFKYLPNCYLPFFSLRWWEKRHFVPSFQADLACFELGRHHACSGWIWAKSASLFIKPKPLEYFQLEGKGTQPVVRRSSGIPCKWSLSSLCVLVNALYRICCSYLRYSW